MFNITNCFETIRERKQDCQITIQEIKNILNMPMKQRQMYQNKKIQELFKFNIICEDEVIYDLCKQLKIINVKNQNEFNEIEDKALLILLQGKINYYDKEYEQSQECVYYLGNQKQVFDSITKDNQENDAEIIEECVFAILNDSIIEKIKWFKQMSDISVEVKFLKSLKYFSEMDNNQLSLLLQNMELKQYTKGDMIYDVDEPAKKVYIVKNGILDAKQCIKDFNVTVNSVSMKQIIGFEEVIDQRKREKSLMVVSDYAEVYEISASVFLKFLEKNINLSTLFIQGKQQMRTILQKSEQIVDSVLDQHKNEEQIYVYNCAKKIKQVAQIFKRDKQKQQKENIGYDLDTQPEFEMIYKNLKFAKKSKIQSKKDAVEFVDFVNRQKKQNKKAKSISCKNPNITCFTEKVWTSPVKQIPEDKPYLGKRTAICIRI